MSSLHESDFDNLNEEESSSHKETPKVKFGTTKNLQIERRKIEEEIRAQVAKSSKVINGELL